METAGLPKRIEAGISVNRQPSTPKEDPMRRYVHSCALALVAVIAAGCSEREAAPLAPDDPVYGNAKGGPKAEETDPLAIWEWFAIHPEGSEDGSEAAFSLVRGDGKATDGKTALGSDSPLTGAYEGEVCGVHAKIFWSGSNYGGDAVFDADFNRDSSCGPRYLEIDLPGGTVQDAPFINVREIMYVGEQEIQQQLLRLGNLRNIPECEYMQFGVRTEDPDDEPWRVQSGGVYVTGLEGTGPEATRGGGHWEVKTVPPHTGTCYYTARGKTVEGQSYTVPFHFEVTELESTGPEGPS
jgi:hypothetical protein